MSTLQLSKHPFMQCRNLPFKTNTTLGIRNLLLAPPNYHIIPFLQVLYTAHSHSNAPLDIRSSLFTYSLQCPFTKSYQYLGRAILFNIIHDSLGNSKSNVLAQRFIYSHASTICPCPNFHLTNIHIPSMCELCYEL